MDKVRILLRDVERFIQRKEHLRRKLQKEYLEQRMFKEADLQSCTYMHLRRFLKSDKRWRVFVNAYSKSPGRFHDLAVMEGLNQRLIIEIKRRVAEIPAKDRKALNSFLEKHEKGKAYFITTVKKRSEYKKLGSKKTSTEKNRLIEVVVDLGLRRAHTNEFRDERDALKSALQLGDSEID